MEQRAIVNVSSMAGVFAGWQRRSDQMVFSGLKLDALKSLAFDPHFLKIKASATSARLAMAAVVAPA